MIYVVQALAGERLDRIARKLFGAEGAGAVEALYAANPGLAAAGDPVPTGTSIVVPDAVQAPESDQQRQWE